MHSDPEPIIEQARKLCHTEPQQTLELLQPLLPQLQGDQRAAALQVLGDAHYMVSDYQNAVEAFYQTIAAQPEDLTISAEAYWQLAVIHNELGGFEEAINQLEHVLRLGNADQKLRALYKTSSAYFGMGEPRKALQVLEEVRARHTEFADPCWFEQTLTQLAYGHHQLSLLPDEDTQTHQQQALALLEEAEERAVQIHFPGLEGLIHLYRGQILQTRGDFEQATASFHQALGIADIMHYTWLRLEALLTLAEAYQRENQHEQAIELLESSLQDAQNAGLKDKVARAYELLAESQEKLGDPMGAIVSLKTAHQLHKRFAHERAKWWAQSVEARMQLQQALLEAEVHKLRSQELEILTAQLHSLAHLDPLTGVLNRRALDLHLPRYQSHAAPYTMVLLDIDHFKTINDRFGHQTGDEVLRHLGQLLKHHSRQSDLVIRYGGEEFLLVLTLQPQNAHAACERLRYAIATYPWNQIQPDLWVTASVGYACSDDRTPEALIQEADQCLYQAKHSGRNRVWPATDGALNPA